MMLRAQRGSAPARRAVVTGVGGPAGQAAARALTARGYGVVGVDMQDQPTLPSNTIAFERIPAACAPGFHTALESIVHDHEATWLFPTVCDELPIIARHADRLRSDGICIFISSLARVSICRDKWWTAQVLEEKGVPVPRSARGDADHDTINRLGRPLVSRPRSGRGGRGVVVHEQRVAPEPDRSQIWQQFMPGTEYDVQLLLDPALGFGPLAAGVFEKTGLREGRTGNATGLVPTAAPDVKELAIRAALALELQGPIDLDIRRDAQGRPRVLEINPRIGAHALQLPQQFDSMVELHQRGHHG
jgi:carbamoylphosphate synthase large subunit